jgi:predicted unusual protein kinase regulating ubiquinone biosynthesis (AarF/ABC1/UbiB family)
VKKPLDRLRTGVLERGIALGKLSVGASLGAGWLRVKGFLASDDERARQVREFLADRASRLAGELGELKGSLMKAGQMLSVYGEQFLPPEINATLKSLQKDSPPVAWPLLEPILKTALGPKLAFLDVDATAVGAASLGQVHRATDRRNGAALALKIRYPGVDRAIESDLKVLRRLLAVAGVLPTTENLDAVFEEAHRLLRQEVDYVREAAATKRYASLVADDERFVVPTVVEEFSSPEILATTFEPSWPVDSGEVLALSQERRDRLALAFFELYLRELVEFRAVQSDPHFGNFGVRLGRDGAPDRWVLYDFGALRELPEDFVASYCELVRGSLEADRARIGRALEALGLVAAGDPPEYAAALAELSELGMETVRGPGPYRWGESTLPARVAEKARQMLFRGRVRVPRPEMLSVDRKTSGVFVTMAKLRAVVDVRPLVEKYLGA